MKLRRLFAGFAVGILCSIGAGAQQSEPAPDNTKVNQADRANGQPTADQAKNDARDRELMKAIRKSIIADHSLSTYAHNIKIIAQDGKVTLKGPVRSAEEKETVLQKATDAAGAGNVTDDITVKEKGPAKGSS